MKVTSGEREATPIDCSPRPATTRLGRVVGWRLAGSVGPGAHAYAVAGAVGERPVRWRIGVVDDAAARGECRRQPRFDVLARD